VTFVPVGLTKNGDDERLEEVDFVGDRGPRGFFSLGDGLAEVGVCFGVAGDLGVEAASVDFFGVGVDFSV
jgi:hypothetical protein